VVVEEGGDGDLQGSSQSSNPPSTCSSSLVMGMIYICNWGGGQFRPHHAPYPRRVAPKGQVQNQGGQVQNQVERGAGQNQVGQVQNQAGQG
jgi:hypothetical protein